MHPLFANSLWLLSTLPDAFRYQRASKNVQSTQIQVLLAIIRANQQTVFGREYHFERIHSVESFQQNVPLMDYDSYMPYIESIMAGDQHILTLEPVTLLEPTSGSTAATKLIPYTATLKQQFNRGIAPWITNLFTHYPGLLNGQAYWSISPIDMTNQYTSGGIPIGFEDDTEYLGNAGMFLRSILAVPSLVKLIQDMDAFRYVTLLFLLRSANLRLISVWNPTFLILLLEGIIKWGEQLAQDVAQGKCHPPTDVSSEIIQSIHLQLTPQPKRAKIIREALTLQPADRHRLLWRNLKLVSCWADGMASQQAQQLHDLLPQAHLQAKGLIATEAFVSFPMLGKEGSQLAITSHFLEFISEADDIHLAHELVQGEQYRMVLTTGGGLVRYQLHDIIESLGDLAIRFIGRSANIADFFGEKVSEGHVRSMLEKLFPQMPQFVILSPEADTNGRIAYTLFTTASIPAEVVEQNLCENYHYAYCRRLKQLSHANVVPVTENATEGYLQACIERGQRAGDVKATILYRHGNLTKYLTRYH